MFHHPNRQCSLRRSWVVTFHSVATIHQAAGICGRFFSSVKNKWRDSQNKYSVGSELIVTEIWTFSSYFHSAALEDIWQLTAARGKKKKVEKNRLQPNSELCASVVFFSIKKLQLHSNTANEGFYHPFKRRVGWGTLKFEWRSIRNFSTTNSIKEAQLTEALFTLLTRWFIRAPNDSPCSEGLRSPGDVLLKGRPQ